MTQYEDGYKQAYEELLDDIWVPVSVGFRRAYHDQRVKDLNAIYDYVLDNRVGRTIRPTRDPRFHKR